MQFKWTIRRKLMLLTLLALVFLSVVSAVGYWGASFESSGKAILKNQSLLRVNFETDRAHDAVRADVLDALRLGDDLTTQRQEQNSASESTENKAVASTDSELSKEIAALRTSFLTHKKSVAENSKASLGGNHSAEFNKLVKTLATASSSYVLSADQLIEQAFANPEGARLIYPTFESTFRDLEKSGQEVTQYLEKQSKQDVEREREQAQRNRSIILTFSSLAMLALFLISWWIAKSITTPLQRAVKVAMGVADGDLTQNIEVTGSDETAQLLSALKRMNEGLSGKMARVAGEVSEASEAILLASRQLVAGNSSLANRTEAQASTVEETAASAEELAATVKENAANSQQAKLMAEAASSVAMKGGEIVTQVVDTMHDIRSRSEKIREITALIDGIAFQTNILALNAAVEAARAGEAGRGFAVVATEVRSLAQRSATAAKEIKQLIDNTAEQVKRGSELANQAGTAMHETVESFRRVTPLMFDIASASSEQSDGVDQITQAMMQIDDMTQQNAALVEEAGAAAESLERQAASLIDLLQVFKVGKSTTTHAKPVMSPSPAPRINIMEPIAPRARVPSKPANLSQNDLSADWREF